MMLRHHLGLALMSAALIGIAACDRSPESTSAGSNTATPGEQSAPSSNNNTMAGGNTTGAGNSAATQPATSSSSKLPGLPSVNGTSVEGLSTADAAATRLIDEAKNDLAKGDISKAKTLIGEMQQKGMYDSLSAPVKSQVDELAIQADKTTPTTLPQ
jgi:hypothetical protein